ncbi:MAG TPA: dihydrolipoyl dehydrogenase [Saprospiraceae bacterium]|nr:dihydrolipoyl dehydrogenase [Saprospiraceae bacterium]
MNVVVIGSGPGGYVAAIRCAQLGMEVSLVEKYDRLGGTCLNVGCIPSKALLDSSELYHQALHKSALHGIRIPEIQLDWPKMLARKQEVVDQNTNGIAFLMKKNKIRVIHGTARFADPHSLIVTDQNSNETSLAFDRCIIATGSKPVTPDIFQYDGKRIISSTEALQLAEVPRKMAIIGAGVIGLEIGSVFARLGTAIEVVEYLDRILPGMDSDCSRELQKSLTRLGFSFHLGRSVTEVKNSDHETVLLRHQSKNQSDIRELEADYVLIAVGRRPYTQGLDLEKAGIRLDEKGKILVDESLQTTAANIYAIGDVVRGAMLAHKAEEEGVFVAEYLSGQKPEIHYQLIPGVVYTWPEMAGVGHTEEELKQAGRNFKIGKFPFKALGRARASLDLDGMVKVLADQQTDEILGVHILGARAADMIMEAVSLMSFRASAEDLSRISHPHPTYTEAIREAALDATAKRALHM